MKSIMELTHLRPKGPSWVKHYVYQWRYKFDNETNQCISSNDICNETIWYDIVMYEEKKNLCQIVNFYFWKTRIKYSFNIANEINIYVFLCICVICFSYYLIKILNHNFSNTHLLSILFSHERKRYGRLKCHYWRKTWIRNRSMVKNRTYKLKLESRLHITSTWFSKGIMQVVEPRYICPPS